jgi:hypothetical protein
LTLQPELHQPRSRPLPARDAPSGSLQRTTKPIQNKRSHTRSGTATALSTFPRATPKTLSFAPFPQDNDRFRCQIASNVHRFLSPNLEARPQREKSRSSCPDGLAVHEKENFPRCISLIEGAAGRDALALIKFDRGLTFFDRHRVATFRLENGMNRWWTSTGASRWRWISMDGVAARPRDRHRDPCCSSFLTANW